MYSKNKTNISSSEINKITNMGENHDIGELVDNCLAKNNKHIKYIMNEIILALKTNCYNSNFFS